MDETNSIIINLLDMKTEVICLPIEMKILLINNKMHYCISIMNNPVDVHGGTNKGIKYTRIATLWL